MSGLVLGGKILWVVGNIIKLSCVIKYSLRTVIFRKRSGNIFRHFQNDFYNHIIDLLKLCVNLSY